MQNRLIIRLLDQKNSKITLPYFDYFTKFKIEQKIVINY